MMSGRSASSSWQGSIKRFAGENYCLPWFIYLSIQNVYFSVEKEAVMNCSRSWVAKRSWPCQLRTASPISFGSTLQAAALPGSQHFIFAGWSYPGQVGDGSLSSTCRCAFSHHREFKQSPQHSLPHGETHLLPEDCSRLMRQCRQRVKWWPLLF